MVPISFFPKLRIICSQKPAKLIPKPTKIQSGIVTSTDVEESSFSSLRIKEHCRGIHTELVGSRRSEEILIYRITT